jgi:hypothetical protein
MTAFANETARYAAYSIFAPAEGQEFQNGDVIAVGRRTNGWGKIFETFTLLHVAEFEGISPTHSVQKRKNMDLAHSRNRLNFFGFEYGDRIKFGGKEFTINAAPGYSITLTEVGTADTDDEFVPDEDGEDAGYFLDSAPQDA